MTGPRRSGWLERLDGGGPITDVEFRSKDLAMCAFKRVKWQKAYCWFDGDVLPTFIFERGPRGGCQVHRLNPSTPRKPNG